ncbi:MAG: hypothetical protein BJ554DRAFT_7527, partial [Olpidium bornovanus]
DSAGRPNITIVEDLGLRQILVSVSYNLRRAVQYPAAFGSCNDAGVPGQKHSHCWRTNITLTDRTLHPTPDSKRVVRSLHRVIDVLICCPVNLGDSTPH